MRWLYRHKDYNKWALWYAWYPVYIYYPVNITVWLEYIERVWEGGFDTGNWIYRIKKESK